MSLAIETVGLGKRFGSTEALVDLDLQVETGEVFGLIGPNGAGKTTTMRLLLDVIRPTSGRLAVLGLEPRSNGPRLRERLAFLPGELRLTSRATGRELLDFYARLQGGVTKRAYEALAERLGLDLVARVGTLSKGNKQKLGLVQAFMRPAELLILDEPTSGLDPVMQRVFLELVQAAQADGRTVLLSSHVLSEIQQVAGRVAILRHGRLAKLESVAALRAGAPRRVRLNARREDLARVRGVLEALPGLTGLALQPSHEGAAEGELVARYAGAPGPFLEAVRQLPLTDLVLAEPDLEEAVMTLYAEGDRPVVGGGNGGER